MKKLLISLAAIAAITASGISFAQTKWDLPSGYGANTFQVQNLTQFAADIDKATAGKLKSRCTQTHHCLRPMKSSALSSRVKPRQVNLFCRFSRTKRLSMVWIRFRSWPPAMLIQNG